MPSQFYSFLFYGSVRRVPGHDSCLGFLGWIVINANKLGQNFRENLEVQVYLLENGNRHRTARTSGAVRSPPSLYVKSYRIHNKGGGEETFREPRMGQLRFLPRCSTKNPLPASVNFKVRKEQRQSGFVVQDHPDA